MVARKKDCFGILDRVFPMGKEGLREIVPVCFECPEKKECLQAALKTDDGYKLREAALSRQPVGGMIGRLRRWSEKKELSRLSKLERGTKQ